MNGCTVAQLTDLHLRPPGQPVSRVVETNMLAVRALRAVAALRPVPDATVITGDLTDGGQPAEYTLLRTILAREATGRVYLIPGNHDDRNAMAELPGVQMQDDFIQYAVDDLPLRLVMLDTLVPGAPHGELCARRLGWLDRTLAQRPDQPTLVAMHHPPFACGLGHADEIALRDPGSFAAVLARHRQVQRVVCGHHHRAVTGSVGGVVATICPSVAHQMALDLSPEGGGALVLEPPAYLLHRLMPGGGLVSHQALVEAFPGPFPFLS